MNPYEYVRGRVKGLLDPNGLAAQEPSRPGSIGEDCDAEELGTSVPYQILEVQLMWRSSHVTPEVGNDVIKVPDIIGGGIGVIDILPGPAKPPIGIPPGYGGAVVDMGKWARKIANNARLRDGVHIWLKVQCLTCECWTDWHWVYGPYYETRRSWLPAEDPDHVWHECTNYGPDIHPPGGWPRGFDPITDLALIFAAIPGCKTEALARKDCKNHSTPSETIGRWR